MKLPVSPRALVCGAGAIASVVLARELFGRLREAEISGQVAVVTGGSRGLGLLIARELGRAGASVAILARDAGELARAREQLADWDVDAIDIPCDVGDEAQVAAAIEQVEQTLGPVDILVNNAGIIQVGPLAESEVRDFADAQRVMFWGVLFPTLAVLPGMRERRSGRIANVTSIGGRLPVPHLVPYNSAKFAAVGLSEALRTELANDGITVTTIVPGLMRTGSYLNAEYKEPRRLEFGMFSMFATWPVISIDAERAARRVVTAICRGEGDVTIGLPALLATRFHGLFPGLTTDIASLVARGLPKPPAAPTHTHPVRAIEQELDSRPFELATALGRSAAERFNEVETAV